MVLYFLCPTLVLLEEKQKKFVCDIKITDRVLNEWFCREILALSKLGLGSVLT